MDDSKSLHTSHSKLTLRRQSPAVTLTSVLLLCQPILYLAEHLYNTASILTRNRILLYDRKKSMLLWLCFVDSLLDHRSEVDQLHIGAVFSKFSRLQSVQQLPSKSEKQSEQLYLDLRIYLSSNWKKKKKLSVGKSKSTSCKFPSSLWMRPCTQHGGSLKHQGTVMDMHCLRWRCARRQSWLCQS